MSSSSSQWSDWAWSSKYNCYERYVHGQWYYEYDQNNLPPAPLPPPTPHNVPRHADPSNLAANFASQMRISNPAQAPHHSSGDTGGEGSSSYQHYPSTGMYNIERRDSAAATNISSRYGQGNENDKGYKLYKSKYFVFGRIFKVLWSEPSGTGGTEITVDAVSGSSHSKIRRFVVIDSRKGHSICLPILTYSHQGTFKNGAHPEDHAVIYSTKHPEYLHNEVDYVKKKSIKCVMDSPHHKLDPASRLNYAKLYTVEHNVKVCFIGSVSADYEQRVVVDYNRTHPVLPNRPSYIETSEASEAMGGGPSMSAGSPETAYTMHPGSPGYGSQSWGGMASGSGGNYDSAAAPYPMNPYGSAQDQSGYSDDRRQQ